MKEKWKKTLKSNEVILASVAGGCLIVKVWLIRNVFHQEVDVNSLIFPLIMLLVYEVVAGSMKKRKKPVSFRWNHPLYWSIAIVVVTTMSMIGYLN
jgi:hypothetical protein